LEQFKEQIRETDELLRTTRSSEDYFKLELKRQTEELAQTKERLSQLETSSRKSS
jgi:hypothetical protein